MTTQAVVSAMQEPDIPGLCRPVSELSPMPMAAVVEPGHVVRYVNRAFCLLAGKTGDELTGKPFPGALSGEDEYLSLLSRVYETGQAHIHTGKENSAAHPLCWSYIMSPLLAVDGRVLGVMVQVTETAPFHRQATALNQALLIGSVRQHELTEEAGTLNEKLQTEIIEHRQAELALRESEARYRTLFNLGPIAVYSCDASGAVRDFNRRAVDLWGREPQPEGPEFFCGSYKMYHPSGAFLPHEQCPMVDVLAGRTPEVRDMEVQIERPDGSRIICLANIHALKNERGEITGAINCFVDITERQRAEREVRRAGDRFRFLAESMPQKIFTASPGGVMDYLNRQWLDYAGISPGQMNGWGSFLSVHPVDREESIRLWRHSIDTGEPFQLVQRFLRADGIYRWHLSRAHAMRGPTGEISMWIGSDTDIHEERKKEEELQRVNEDLRQFAFAASHDLQEPLRAVSIYSQLLVSGYKGPLDDQAVACLRFITDGTSQMRSMLTDLLSYTEVDAEHDEDTFVELNAVIGMALQALKTAREESGAIITFGHLPTVHGQSARFVQLFQNLIGNAIKYRGKEPPRIDIAAEKRDGEWHFSVADNGIGIEPAYYKTIFGVFKRLHGKAIPGTGIGLAICQRVVERYGGRIWVESEPGRGTTFRFILPIARETDE